MKKTVRNTVLQKIEKGDIKMMSGFSVLLEKIGNGAGAFLLFLVLTVISGGVIFWLQENTDLLTGSYGRPGFRAFTETFPYLIIFSFACLFIIMVYLMRRYDFSYKKPFIAVLSLVFAAVILAGWASSKTSPGRQFFRNQKGFIYYGTNRMGKNVAVGMVKDITDDGLYLSGENGSFDVKFSGNTHFPTGKPAAGDFVRVVGEWKGEAFEATGIRIIQDSQFNPKGQRDGNGRMRHKR